MLSKSKYIALICGAISVAVTVIFYLLVFNNIFTVPMRWVSLMFLILAEGIGTAKAFKVRRTIFGVSNLVTSAAHIAFVLLLSIIFVNLFPLAIKTYILLNILALCVLLLVDVVIVFFTNNVTSQNNKMKESQSVMGCCVEKAASLCVEFSDTDYKKDFDEIVEMFPDAYRVSYQYRATVNGSNVLVANVVLTDDKERIMLADSIFFGLLRKLGIDTLYQNPRTQEYTGEVDTLDSYRYKTDYDLGDVVKVINEYGIEAEAQITEILESDDTNDGYAVEPHFEYFN